MTSYLILCLVVFIIAYLVNTSYVTVFYHRAWTHQSIEIHPAVERFVLATAPWVTGIDPKGWCTMHRLHHLYSDTEKDPHSPKHKGFFKLLLVQLYSYEDALKGLMRKDPYYTNQVKDLNFEVSWLNKKKLWLLPYVIQIGITLFIGFAFDAWLLAAAYYFGIMSHPIEGWLINSFGHMIGYRNFEIDDNSRNNWIVSLLVVGEGFQNNHHKYPESAKFSIRWFEIDLGYTICLLLEKMGAISIKRQHLAPALA